MSGVNGVPVIPTTAGASGELAVFVALGKIVAALPARFVTRLVLPESVREHEVGTPSLVSVEGKSHAGWDLAELFGATQSPAAWVLLALPHRRKSLAIALRTGPCLVVDAMPPVVRVPSGVIARRGQAIAGAFAARKNHGSAAVGVELDPRRLFTAEELDACESLLAGAP